MTLSIQPQRRPLYLVFDVESVGLHGEGFAVGWVLLDASSGAELEEGMAWCHPKLVRQGDYKDRLWIEANIPPLDPKLELSHKADVRAAFWATWRRVRKDGAWLAADVAWPVEARFLFDCLDGAPSTRVPEGPYPLIDIASVRLGRGFDPLMTEDRLERELPAHNPLNDARQSARLLFDALRTDLSAANIMVLEDTPRNLQ